jgi:hypothetical protein
MVRLDAATARASCLRMLGTCSLAILRLLVLKRIPGPGRVG